MAIDVDQLRERLAQQSREPFVAQLAEWLAKWSDALSAPGAGQEIAAWIRGHPDRAAQVQAILGRLAGYTEKLEIKTDRYATLDALSDAELEVELCRRLGLSVEQLRATVATPVTVLPQAPAQLTASGEWASGGPAT